MDKYFQEYLGNGQGQLVEAQLWKLQEEIWKMIKLRKKKQINVSMINYLYCC